MKLNRLASLVLFTSLLVPTSPAASAPAAPAPADPPPTVVFREVRYEGTISDDEARFAVELNAESLTRQETSQLLFEGEIALMPPKLPAGLRIERSGNQYRLVISKAGTYQVKLELVAKITKAEPWNQVSFTGPMTPIARVSAQASGADLELQLLNATLLESVKTNGSMRVKGYLGAEQAVSLRWSRSSSAAEVARKAVLSVDTTATAQITPALIRHVTQFHYEILQGKPSQLTLALPASHTLTRLAGEQIRDWEIQPGGGSGGRGASAAPPLDPSAQLITLRFVKPLEKEYQLTVYSEQTVETAAASTAVVPPQPLEVERESGSFTLSTEDTVVEVVSSSGLRQVNAAAGSLSAYRFNGRPLNLALKLRRMEPVINVAAHVSTRLEETRLLVSHALSLNVEKAGIYALELRPQTGFTVADVRGQGVEDWKLADAPAGGKVLRVNFSSRVLGPRALEVQLEQPLKTFPEQIVIAPVRVTGAAKETAQLGASSAPGISLKTAELDGLREVPVRSLRAAANPAPSSVAQSAVPTQALSDESLGYTADKPDWRLTLSTERLAARVIAEIFNLITVGDGIVGGSATVRYGLLNQGVQEFELSLPSNWKNIEFTGPNIRRKEQKPDNHWVIALQDKAWGGYTLVVTYDYQFEPKGATLPIGGIHAVGVERETGSVAVATAANLQLNPKPAGAAIRRVDEAELGAADRALLTRSALLAYQYSEPRYELSLEARHFAESPVLSAVADRAQLTTTLNEAGELLTQASFMVKNNDKQYQQFKLPVHASFWNCYVNGQAVKAERDNPWLMVPLPRGANRDEAFAVDIVYAETNNLHSSLTPAAFRLEAPQTDVPLTYAEWQLYTPPTLRLSSFGGNMTVARGTTYDLHDAWERFGVFYRDLITRASAEFFGIAALVFLVLALVAIGIRRGAGGLVSALVALMIICVVGAMMLPALSRAKSRASRISAVNNLKQIGTAMKTWAVDHEGRFPASFGEMSDELGRAEQVLLDPESGQKFVYVGGGYSDAAITPDSVVAFSPAESKDGYRHVLLADASVQSYSRDQFEAMSRRGYIVRAGAQMAANQAFAVAQQQFQPSVQATVQPTAAIPSAPSLPHSHALRIEVPHNGLQPFFFSKVLSGTMLNAAPEPLSISAGVMKLQTYQTAQMLIELAAFLLGLLIWWWQWRTGRNSFALTIGLALMLASVGHLLVARRILHLGFIVVIPLLTLVLAAWLTRRLWPHFFARVPKMPAAPAESPVPPTVPPVAPPAVAAIAFLLFVSNAAAATNPPAAADSVVPVPAMSIPAASSVAMPPEVFRAVSARAAAPELTIPSAVSLLSATYTGAVNDRVGQFEVVLQLSATKPDQKVVLFANDVAVEEFSSTQTDAKLLREGSTFAVLLPRRGDATLRFKLLVKLGGDVTKRRLGFAIPPALTSQLTATIDQPDADVEFPTAISFKHTTAQQQTRVEAILGSADHVELRWTPRVRRAAEIALNVTCSSATLVAFGGGALNERSTLDFQITQGELRQARVRIPAGHRLLRVEGDSIRTWELTTSSPPLHPMERGPGGEVPASPSVASSPSPPQEERAGERRPSDQNLSTPAGQVLVVDLLKGIGSSYRLTLETEQVLGALPAEADIEIPHALDVKRETGLLALQGEEDLEVTVERSDELYRVDAEEFTRASSRPLSNSVNAFRFLKPEFALRARAAAIQPQIEATLRNSFRVGAEQVSLSAEVEYTIKRAGIFSLKLALPAGYKLEDVTGNNVLQWNERTETQPHQVDVTLRQRTTGSCNLRLSLLQTYKELPKTFAVAGVHPLGVQKLTGFVSVTSESGVALKTGTADGLTEIPASSVPGVSTLAYKPIAAEPQDTAAWKLSLATEAVESWLRAEIVNTLTLDDALVSGRAIVRYEIQNAPVKELRLKIPAQFRNVEISAPNIRRRDHQGDVWTLEFQSKIRGVNTVNVTWDLPRSSGTNRLDLAGISADGVERETGILAVVARPPLQVTEASSTDLKPLDVRDLPDWAGRPDDATVLAYRYLRPGYQLAVNAQRHEEAEVLQALAENVNLTTVVADDGQMMTALSLSVRNSGRQHLEIALPPGSTVWSAFVAGQPVKPCVSGGKLLLPIERAGAEDAPISIEMTYVGANPFPRTRGDVQWVSPALDVPFKSARWELFLPSDYQYSDFAGTMTRETAAATAIQTSSFSSLDYSSREAQRKVELARESSSDLENARRNLSIGNVKQAYQSYNSARAKSSQNDVDAQQLEQQLRQGQANVLINAQNAFIGMNFENGSLATKPAGINGRAFTNMTMDPNAFAVVNGGALQSGGQSSDLNANPNYDNRAAEAQWTKLQQAQELGAAKVTPIHVNLPTRGLRHAFTQVLQTEIGKPMSIRLTAVSGKLVSWPSRIGTGLGAFLLLWLLVAAFTRGSRQARASA